jgi:hypothetical protein
MRTKSEQAVLIPRVISAVNPLYIGISAGEERG